MSNKDIWIVYTKSKILIDSPLAMDGSEFCFGEAFVPSHGIEDAISCIEDVMARTKQALFEDKLVLNDISKCIRYYEDEWNDDSELSSKIKKAVAKARQSDEIIFGVFRSSEFIKYHSH